MRILLILAALALALFAPAPATAEHLRYGWQPVDGLDIFYREGGAPEAPTIVFLHGNPASSIQYDEVMQRLAGQGFHVLAMDYPSFGYSSAPDRRRYAYTFDHLAQTVTHFLAARDVTRYWLYLQDYGVPVGFRLIDQARGHVAGIIIQNGVIHLDGFPAAQNEEGELRRHWRTRDPRVDARRAAYAASLGFPAPQGWTAHREMSPDAILLMTASEQRPGVIDARNDLWFDYGTNVAHYSEWQAMLRALKLPTLVIWGTQDDFFTTPGALAFLRDAPRAEIHLLDTVHFATLEVPDRIGELIVDYLRVHPDPRGRP